MATVQKKIEKKVKKGVKKDIKNNKTEIVIIAVLFVIGVVLGFFTYNKVSENDTFELNGESVINLELITRPEEYDDERLKYYIEEEGVTCVCFGKDYSDTMVIDSVLQKENGKYVIDLTVAGEYEITYSVSCIKYDNTTLTRKIIVSEAE